MSARRNIFILSGGGSRGAGQVGMLRGLWDAGVVPDMLVGGSVGAINACFAAARLRRLVSDWVPTYHLEDLPTPVRIATTDIATGRAVHHDHGYIPDLLAASAALPGIFPPVVLRGPQGPVTHVDAGVSANVPIAGGAEVARPGDRLWVLDVTRRPTSPRSLRNPLDVLIASLAASVRNRDDPALPAGLEVVRCKLDEAYDCGGVFDFGHTSELIRLGVGSVEQALGAGTLTPAPAQHAAA